MPKQSFDILDYFGALIAGIVFSVVLVISTLFINFAFIRRTDDITAFEKVGDEHED